MNSQRVLEVIEAGARSVREVGRASGAGTCCGGCRPTIAALLEQYVAAHPPDASVVPAAAVPARPHMPAAAMVSAPRVRGRELPQYVAAVGA